MMNGNERKKVNRWLGISMAGLVLLAGVSFAGRPLTIDDADPVDFEQFEFEGGAEYLRDSEFKHWDFPFGLTYGALPALEVGIGLGGQFEERTEILDESGVEESRSENGIGDFVAGAKWQFIRERKWCPRQALAPSVKFPTADEDKGLGSGETDYDLTWVASKSIGGEMGAHINAGYSWMGEPEGEDVGDVAHYGLALDYRIVEPLQCVGEVFTEKELRSGTDTLVQYNLGLRWNPMDTLTLDAAAGSRINGDAPDFTATAGLTWTFGFAGKK